MSYVLHATLVYRIAQDDLKAERVRTLSTMQLLRQQQDKRFEEEATYKARIAELLHELSAVRCDYYLYYDHHYCSDHETW